MKHFYLLYGILATLHAGAFAGDSWPRAPLAVSAVVAVSGQVTDENGAPFPGVNIVVKGTSSGTTTDNEGRYTIEVTGANSVLVFSFVGYLPQEVSVDNRTVIDVKMAPDVQQLAEIVVTALGIRKESKKLGYAATTVQTDQIQSNRTTNFMESLEGKVAGLDISPPAAGAGASTKIRLRGQTAFSGANNAPLIVINGLPMDQGAIGADGNNARDRGDAMQNINPDDIESITILKGATAAALYGSRAGNGAIVITTKSGQLNQGIGIEYTSNYTVSTVLDVTDLQQEYGQGTWNQAQLTGLRPTTQGEAVSSGMLGWGAKLDGEPTINFDGVQRPYVAHPDRIKEFYRDGTAFTNTVALSGGNGKGSFRASFSNLKSSGITPNNEYAKRIANLGLTYAITEKLKLSVNANYTSEENENPPQVGIQGSGEANFLYRMSTSIPLSAFSESVINPVNGITELPTSGFQTTLINPYFSMPRMFFNEEKNRLLATTTLRYELTKWLFIQGRFNYDNANSFNEFNTPTGQGTNNPFNSTGVEFNGNYTINTSQGTDVNADFLIGAAKQFGAFSVDASFGGNTLRQTSRFTNQAVTDFVALGVYSLGNGVTTTTNNAGIGYRARVNSLYGILEVGYKNILFLNLTDRQDWFSTLNPSNNTKNYPSVSGSFIFSELLQNQTWLSYGKLRGAWAQVGSSNGAGYAEGLLTYTVLPQAFNGQKLGNINNTVAPNPGLIPFLVTEKEIGLEFKFFNRRVSFDVAAYDKNTTDQILTVAISNSTGYVGTKQNVGELQNRGMEFFLEVVPVEKNGLRWSSSFNAAHNKSKVLALAPGITTFTQTAFGGNEFIGQLVYQVGLPLNQLSAKTYQRDANGNILLDDQGRVLASDNFVNFGSGLPTWTGGWTNTISYKKLSLLIQFDFKTGGKILSSSALNWLRQGHSKESLVGREGGITAEVYPGIVKSTGLPYSGTPVNPQTFYTDFRSRQIADPFIYDSDFIKLRNITVSYDLTSLVGSKLNFVKGLTLSAACRNVWLIYKDLPNLDPEAFASSGDNRVGYEGTSLPTTRNYSVNLNVRF